MDSSILELQDALGRLTDFNQHWGSEQGHGADAGGLANVYQKCNLLSHSFEGVNNKLSEGWATSAELFYKIFDLISESLGSMYVGIKQFTDETYQAELAATNAVESANEAAKDILKELSLLSDTSTTGTSTSTPSEIKNVNESAATARPQAVTSLVGDIYGQPVPTE